MNYFFILGRIPELSCAELGAVLHALAPNGVVVAAGAEAIILSSADDIAIHDLVRRLGGTVKGGNVLGTIQKDFDRSAQYIGDDLSARAAQTGGRLTFAISAYSVTQNPLKGNEQRRVASWIARTGLALKKHLRENGVSVRVVAPRRGECALSSVVVEKNHLTHEPNVEYALLVGDKKIDIGVTAAVQDFEAYSFRDYHRPHRDMKTGLLPPKLARIMVNLAGVSRDATLLDPFCGLGTVLQEAQLLGYRNVWGSDIDERNVWAAKENIEWIKNNSGLDPGRSLSRVSPSDRDDGKRGQAQIPSEIEPDPVFSLKTCDARELASCFSKNSIDAIVTEPTLGPALSKQRPNVSRSEIDSLCSLYVASFKAFHELLKNGGRVVIVFPVWVQREKLTRVPCIDDIMRLGFKNVLLTRDPRLRGDDRGGRGDDRKKRGAIIIARPNARVARELFVFEVL